MIEKKCFTCKDLCACIVTYYPTDITWKNVERLTKYVGCLVIVDNTGEPEHKNIENKVAGYNCFYFWNGGNKGLGYALNRGFNYAKEHGYSLYMTLDQDSLCTDGMIQALIDTINNFDGKAAVGPCWNGEILKENKEVRYLITSGNMIMVEGVQAVGGYDENFFIDSLDMDFSLRLRKNGYKLIKVSDAKLDHKIGELSRSRILKLPYYSHSPSRMFYIYRNHIILAKKHFKQFPLFICKLFVLLIADTFKIIFLESEKYKKIVYAVKGLKDGIKFKSNVSIEN